MSQIREGFHFFEVGNGIPTHISKKGVIYSDRLSGTAYINKNNLSQWNAFPDVAITGGTNNPYIVSGSYSNGTTTLFYNSGGSITITGYYTGATDIFVTGGTYSQSAATATFTNNTGGTFSISGFYRGVNVTGYTYSSTNNTFTINDSTGGTLTASINIVSGLTINSNVSSTQLINTYTTGYSGNPFNSESGFYVRNQTTNSGYYVTINKDGTEDKALRLFKNNVGIGYGHIISATTYNEISPFGGYPTIIGSLAQGNGVALGYKAIASNLEATAIGPQAYADSLATIAIGDGARATGHVFSSSTIPSGIYGNQIVLGDAAFTNGNLNLFIGGGAGINNNFGIVLGGAGSDTTYSLNATNDDHEGYLGWYQHDSAYFSGGVGYVNNWWLGGPAQASQPHDISLNITSALGTDKSGVTFNIIGSMGTGIGDSGDIVFKTGPHGFTGAVLQAATNRLIIKGPSGNIGISKNDPSEKLEVNGFGSFLSGVKLPSPNIGTNRDTTLINPSSTDNLAILLNYPYSGTNVGTGLYISPKGSGLSSSLKSQLVIANTDYVTDPTNAEYWVYRASGTYFGISTGAGGSGTLRPMLLSVGLDNGQNVDQLWLTTNGNIGVGLAVPTAFLHIKAGGTGRAPLKLTSSSGSLLTSPEDGAIEYDGSHFYGTVGTTRYQLDNLVNPVLAANGLSLSSDSKTVVLGQDVNQSGDPATLISNREIPMSSFTINMKDSSGNSNAFGGGSIVSTRISTGINVTTSNTKSGNTNAFNVFNTTTVNFGALSNDTTFGVPNYGNKRYNTQSTGSTITCTSSNKQGVYIGTLQFENDVAGTNNPITITGGGGASVFHAKVDFWPNAGGQRKTVNGSITSYSTFFDCGSILSGTSLTTYIDFEAGRFAGSANNPIFITDRYGFKVLDLNLGTQVTTNRWAFYQEGILDKNFFNGFVGIGISSPQAKLHITAGTTTVPPIIINSGVTTTVPIDGAIEYDGTHFYGTIGSTRKQLDNDASSGTTGTSNSVIVTAKTTNYSVLSTQTGYYFTNEGAVGAISFTLPTAVTNLIYTFINQTGNQLDIIANTGDTIRSGLNVSSSGGTVSTFDIGSSITLVAINATEWIATNTTGTWVF